MLRQSSFCDACAVGKRYLRHPADAPGLLCNITTRGSCGGDWSGVPSGLVWLQIGQGGTLEGKMERHRGRKNERVRLGVWPASWFARKGLLPFNVKIVGEIHRRRVCQIFTSSPIFLSSIRAPAWLPRLSKKHTREGSACAHSLADRLTTRYNRPVAAGCVLRREGDALWDGAVAVKAAGWV